LISSFGWRGAWKVCGGFGMVVGILCIITLYEPPRSDRVEIDIDEPEIL
jgi:hypothetical protein